MHLIMIGQNIQSAHADARALSDFYINTKTEAEIEAIIDHLENQNKLILEILNRINDKKS
jgi:uncharacterized membrane protein